MVRSMRCLLRQFGHRAWLYVDDLLLLFRSAEHRQATCLTVAFLTILNAPVSWKKAQTGSKATWCGWSFDFFTESLHLHAPKLEKLREQLSRLAQGKKVPRKKLEAALGLLMWATSTPPYRDLHCGTGTLKQIHAPQWQHFLDAWDSQAKVIAQPIGLWPSLGGQNYQAWLLRHLLQGKSSTSPALAQEPVDPHPRPFAFRGSPTRRSKASFALVKHLFRT